MTAPHPWRPVVGRQLFLLLVVACGVSLAASGRVTPRLVFDAGLSAAFMPAFQLLAFVGVWRARGQGRGDLARDSFAYLDGNGPWLWWACAMAAIVAFVPPRSIWPWVKPALLSALIPIVWGVALDVRWLRRDKGRSSRAAAVDVVLFRAVGWSAAVAWFFGIAIWYGEVPKIAAWWRP